jgi:hypothetical protein
MSSALTRLTLIPIVAGLALPLQARQDDAERLIALARQALGGEANLSNVRSFTIDARGHALKGSSNSWSKFTIAVEFPDKFVRTNEGTSGGLRVPLSPSPATAGGYLTSSLGAGSALGFNGDHAIAEGLFSPDDYRDFDGVWRPFIYPQRELDEKYLERARIGALPWLLGIFAQPMPGLPARLEAATGAGGATTVIVTGGGSARPRTLTFDPLSHLPASFDGTTFEDYRNIGPVRVPFRLRSSVGVQEITAIHINVTISPKRFRLSGR